MLGSWNSGTAKFGVVKEVKYKYPFMQKSSKYTGHNLSIFTITGRNKYSWVWRSVFRKDQQIICESVRRVRRRKSGLKNLRNGKEVEIGLMKEVL